MVAKRSRADRVTKKVFVDTFQRKLYLKSITLKKKVVNDVSLRVIVFYSAATYEMQRTKNRKFDYRKMRNGRRYWIFLCRCDETILTTTWEEKSHFVMRAP